MRWHVKNLVEDVEVTHLSYAKAWKKFQTVYYDFASKRRNVYLDLRSDVFSQFETMGGAGYEKLEKTAT